MESIPRNVILDLLPAYISGEVSEESKSLIENYAKIDSEVAKMIQSGKIESEQYSQSIEVPNDLEMKTIKHVQRSIRLQIWYVAFATALILIAPLIAMQFTNEVNWGFFDFVVMGFLLFGTGLAFVLISRKSESFVYRIAVAVAVVAVLLLIWINLAVGIIGSEENPVNLLYFGVVGITILGTIISRFQPIGMALTMFVTGLILLLIPVMLLMFWNNALGESSSIGFVFGINTFFAVLFISAALLFRIAARKNNI